MPRTAACQAKIDRVIAALEHREGDRVPQSDFFWSNFVQRCKDSRKVPAEFDPYRYWDLDMVTLIPNVDPLIRNIEVLEDSPERTLVKTGFGATIERHGKHPMPHFNDFEFKTFEQVEALVFDDPRDPRRYFEAIDHQLNSVGDRINLGCPAFIDQVNKYADDFCIFGGALEPHEMVWRIMGTENVLFKIGEDPERMKKILDRLGDFMVGIVEGQIAAADGRLSGMYVFGDIAYRFGMFFSPDYWRYAYMPSLKKICDAIKGHGLKVIYHGCGNCLPVYDDMLEAGIDCYNPLEVKADLDVVALKKQFKNRLAFNGNIDVRVLATNDRDTVRREVLTKLNAAKGGGYLIQSDHSVPDDVDFETFDYFVKLVREYGNYPLNLGEFDQTI